MLGTLIGLESLAAVSSSLPNVREALGLIEGAELLGERVPHLIVPRPPRPESRIA